jgi:hypothetical protein
VIEPSGVFVRKAREIVFPDAVNGQAGWAGMSLELYILPSDVSFYGLSFCELPQPIGEILPTGYFADQFFADIWYHTESMGAGAWQVCPMQRNFFMDDYAYCGAGFPDGWTDGTITWRIPVVWGYKVGENDEYCYKQFGSPYFQIFSMDKNGVFRIAKLGHWVERAPNGNRNRSANVSEALQ